MLILVQHHGLSHVILFLPAPSPFIWSRVIFWQEHGRCPEFLALYLTSQTSTFTELPWTQDDSELRSSFSRLRLGQAPAATALWIQWSRFNRSPLHNRKRRSFCSKYTPRKVESSHMRHRFAMLRYQPKHYTATVGRLLFRVEMAMQSIVCTALCRVFWTLHALCYIGNGVHVHRSHSCVTNIFTQVLHNMHQQPD